MENVLTCTVRHLSSNVRITTVRDKGCFGPQNGTICLRQKAIQDSRFLLLGVFNVRCALSNSVACLSL